MSKKRRNFSKEPAIARGFSDQITQSKKEPRSSIDVSSSNSETPAWQLSRIDEDGKWGWKKIGQVRWAQKILPKLREFETMTWDEILKASGGRRVGNNSHYIPIDNLKKEAQKRLEDLKMDDMGQIFSLRLENKIRIFGKRVDRVLQIIWFDFDHEICPVGGR